MAAPQWTNLIIDRRAAPRRLTDEQFQEWMAGRPIFVSSVMDKEMNPARDAVRAWIHQWGGEPVMWEEIVPRDQRSQYAYLDGVDRSNVFVLLLGSRYGVADDSGASPTHKEGTRAKERGVTRLLFTPADLASSDRDVKVNDWLGSLYNEVSAAKYANPDDLTRQLGQRLRELASAQETPWVKVGPIIVPGSVRQRTSKGETEFVVTAAVKDPTARRALSGLGGWQSRGQVDRLTWGTETFPVDVSDVEIQTTATSEGNVTLTCRLARNRNDNPMHIGLTAGFGRTIGAGEQAVAWARRAILGEEVGRRDATDLLHSMTAPDGPTLPQVLAAHGAREWLAEGLVRLYLIEGLVTKYGGHFERLDVGPAAATTVRVAAVFRLNDFQGSSVVIEDAVPLR